MAVASGPSLAGSAVSATAPLMRSRRESTKPSQAAGFGLGFLLVVLASRASRHSSLAPSFVASPAGGSDAVGRRDMAGFSAAALLGLGAGQAPVHAKSKTLPPEVKENIKSGYKNLLYLIDNWEQETTECVPSCKRTPEKVRSYLGLKSTTDPLFNLDKVLLKVTDAVDPNYADDFSEALEKWTDAIAGGNAEAYVSSFGEYNPGGGTATVEKYLERSRENVLKAKGYLETIAKALTIDV